MTYINTQLEIISSPAKECSDIREIMMLAEAKSYPDWFIQPLHTGLIITLSYYASELQKIVFLDNEELVELEIHILPTIPKNIPGFTGNIKGILLTELGTSNGYEKMDAQTAEVIVYQDYVSGKTQDVKFLANDMDTGHLFPQKMKLLEEYGFVTTQYVSFPTIRLQVTPSHKLATSFQNYISQAREQGLLVEGLVIISDTPLMEPDTTEKTFRLVYKPKSDSS